MHSAVRTASVGRTSRILSGDCKKEEKIVGLGQASNVFYVETTFLSSYPNVRLLSSEGSVLAANMSVLASCSEFFHKLFMGLHKDGMLGGPPDSDFIISTEVAFINISSEVLLSTCLYHTAILIS